MLRLLALFLALALFAVALRHAHAAEPTLDYAGTGPSGEWTLIGRAIATPAGWWYIPAYAPSTCNAVTYYARIDSHDAHVTRFRAPDGVCYLDLDQPLPAAIPDGAAIYADTRSPAAAWEGEAAP